MKQNTEYHITREFLNKARAKIKKYPPYSENDPILTLYDSNMDPEKWRSTMLLRTLKELGFDPYDDNDYGDITE